MLKESLLAWGQEGEESVDKILLDKQVIYMRKLGGTSLNPEDRVYMVNIDGTQTNKYFRLNYTSTSGNHPKGNYERFYFDKPTQALIRIAVVDSNTASQVPQQHKVFFEAYNPNTGVLIDQHVINGYSYEYVYNSVCVNVQEGLYGYYYNGKNASNTQVEDHRMVVYSTKKKKIITIPLNSGYIPEVSGTATGLSAQNRSIIFSLREEHTNDDNFIVLNGISKIISTTNHYLNIQAKYNLLSGVVSFQYNYPSSNVTATSGFPIYSTAKYGDFVVADGTRWEYCYQDTTYTPTGQIEFLGKNGNNNRFISIDANGKSSYSPYPNGGAWYSRQDSGAPSKTWVCGAYGGATIYKHLILASDGTLAQSDNGLTGYTVLSDSNYAMGNRGWSCFAINEYFCALSGADSGTSNAGYYAIWNTLPIVVGKSTELASVGNWVAVTKTNGLMGNIKFLALNSNGYTSTSVDGSTWTTPVNSLSGNYTNWVNMIVTDDSFIAITKTGKLAYSVDGVNWSSIYTPSSLGSHNWKGMAYDPQTATLSALGYNNSYAAFAKSDVKTAVGMYPLASSTTSGFQVAYTMYLPYKTRMFDTNPPCGRQFLTTSVNGIYNQIDAVNNNMFFGIVNTNNVWDGKTGSLVDYDTTSNAYTALDLFTPSSSTIPSYSSIELYEGPKYIYTRGGEKNHFVSTTIVYNYDSRSSNTHAIYLLDDEKNLKPVTIYDAVTGNTTDKVNNLYEVNDVFPMTDKHFVISSVYDFDSTPSGNYRYVTLVSLSCSNENLLSIQPTSTKIDCNTNTQLVADYDTGLTAANQYYPIAIADGDLAESTPNEPSGYPLQD